MSYPRKYPVSGGGPLLPADWNAMCDRIDGYTPAGVFKSPYTYLITYTNPDYYCSNAFQTVYGGVTDEGSVDGADFQAVIEAALGDTPKVLLLGDMDVTATAPIEYPTQIKIKGFGVGNTIIRSAVNGYIFTPSGVAQKEFCGISDMSLITTADGAAQGAISLDGVNRSVFENLKITTTAGTHANIVGIKLTDENEVGCYFNQFRNVDIIGYNKGYWFTEGATGWESNNNMVLGGRIQNNNVGIHFDDGNSNWLFNPDLEGNTTAIDVDTELNGLIGGFFETNTTDIDIAAGEAFTALGPRYDLTLTKTGRLLFLGAGYGDHDATTLDFPYYNTVDVMSAQTSNDTADPGALYQNPDTSYVDFSNYCKMKVDFTTWWPRQVRLYVVAQGNEAGANKGLRMVSGAATEICKYEWGGNALQTEAGDWTAFASSADVLMRPQVKGSSATEDITVYKMQLQFR